MTVKQRIITNWSTISVFTLWIYVFYGSSCPWSRACPAFALPWISPFDAKKWHMTFLWWKDDQINVIQHNWEFLRKRHANNNLYRYRMSLKQILNDKIIIIKINANNPAFKMFFVNIFFYFSLWLWRHHLTCSTLLYGRLDVFIFR